MTDRPLVSIVIPTINTPRLTKVCLESVKQNTSVPHEIIVVNNSTAKPIVSALNQFKIISVIQNKKNLGFAKAANQGVAKARGMYVCFLNSDTLVPPLWMERLLWALKQPGVGAVVPTANHYGYSHAWPPKYLPTSQATVDLTDKALQQWHPNTVENMLRIQGFCLVLSRQVMNKIGLFDEQFFFGLEDDDYSLRLRLEGYHLLRLKSVFIYHLSGGSTRKHRRPRIEQNREKKFMQKWGSSFKINSSEKNWDDFNTLLERKITHLCKNLSE